MPRTHKPRSGSRQFIPHRRAKKESGRVRTWPKKEGVLGFAGYKAGMVHYIYRDTDPNSPTKGQNISAPATVIEVPPLKAVSVNIYKKEVKGLKLIGSVTDKKELEKVEGDSFRLLVQTQPKQAGFPKKRPDEFELQIGGTVQEQIEVAKNILGNEIPFSEVFSEGELTDVLAITKGKGFQGPIKKFGIKILRKKTEKSYRHAGHIGGGLTPTHTPWYAPMGGKIGYHQRTEYNKQIIAINKGVEKKEFPHYGLLGENYVLVSGSVPGPRKRLIKLIKPIRAPEKERKAPEMVEVIR